MSEDCNSFQSPDNGDVQKIQDTLAMTDSCNCSQSPDDDEKIQHKTMSNSCDSPQSPDESQKIQDKTTCDSCNLSPTEAQGIQEKLTVSDNCDFFQFPDDGQKLQHKTSDSQESPDDAQKIQDKTNDSCDSSQSPDEAQKLQHKTSDSQESPDDAQKIQDKTNDSCDSSQSPDEAQKIQDKPTSDNCDFSPAEAQKIQRISITEHIFKQDEAKLWNEDISRKPYALHELDEGSDEYLTIKDHFSSTTWSYSAKKIQRVENPYLLGQYLLKKQKMNEKIGTVEERKLFHATREVNIDSICQDNFNWRLRGKSRGHKFGQGVSFTPDAFYASHFNQGEKVMFRAKVLVGKSCIGDTSTNIPSERFDTTRNLKQTVLVKYEDDDFYPEYIIYYE